MKANCDITNVNGIFNTQIDAMTHLEHVSDIGGGIVIRGLHNTTHRGLDIAFTKDYLAELQNNKDTSKWYAYECEHSPRRYSGELSLKYVGVRIAFWDANVERPKAPYLAEIGF